MIKSVIAGAVAMAVVSFGVNAAPTIPQGQGKVTFNGTVVDAPCSISQKSASRLISLLILDSFQKASLRQEVYPNQWT